MDYVRAQASYVADEVLAEVAASAKNSILLGASAFLCTIDSIPAMLSKLSKQDAEVCSFGIDSC